MEISWLDFSERDRKKVLQVLDILSEPNAVDELGIGVIRDYFADRFFPGTSTLQTRAKYFVLSVYIFKDLEKENFNNYHEYLAKLDSKEEECARILLNIEENKGYNRSIDEIKGIIGWRNLTGKNKKWVKRGPTDIYWNGIKRYKIFKNENLTLKEYAKIFVEKKKEILKNKNLKELYKTINEDGIDSSIEIASEILSMWEVPNSYCENWIEKLRNNDSIKLTKEEALFLQEKIISSQGDTLIGAILKNCAKQFASLPLNNEIFENLESIILNSNIQEEIKDEYIFAKNIAEFLYCMQIRYNLIISKEINEELRDKWKEYSRNMEQIAKKADLNRLKKCIKDTRLIKVLEELKSKMLSDKNLNEIEMEIDRLVIDREKFKKKERAKLGEKIDTKGKWMGLDKLTYRTFNVYRLVKDIVEGLEEC